MFSQSVYEWGLNLIRAVQSLQSAPLTVCMKAVSFLSDPKAYMLILPLIFLCYHQPRFDEIVMNRCDLGLHGHTHNGQFWPYSWIIKLVYRCSYGYYKEGASQFYISSGIGFAGPPYRIGTKSELAVIRVTFHRN